MPRGSLRCAAVFRVVAGALLSLLAVSCASIPGGGSSLSRAGAEAAWSARQATLREVRAWDISGRISVSGPDGSWNARIRWSQRDDTYDIDFLSLFGQQVARLEGSGEDVVLQLPDQEPQRAATAGELLAASFGWSAPVDALRYWILGMPRPHTPALTRLDEHGRLSRLEQEGWSVEYPQYTGVSADPGDLPRRLMLEGAPVSIRLVVDSWDLGG